MSEDEFSYGYSIVRFRNGRVVSWNDVSKITGRHEIGLQVEWAFLEETARLNSCSETRYFRETQF